MDFNLPQLQNNIKRDPESYKEEFSLQYTHFKSLVDIFSLNPDKDGLQFGNLVMFLAHTVGCYKGTEVQDLPDSIIELLSKHYVVMNPDLRSNLAKALILMRNKNLIAPNRLLALFFTLFRCQDKNLRVLLHSHIVTDIKNINQKTKNNKLNKEFQNFMYTMLKDTNEVYLKLTPRLRPRSL